MIRLSIDARENLRGFFGKIMKISFGVKRSQQEKRYLWYQMSITCNTIQREDLILLYSTVPKSRQNGNGLAMLKHLRKIRNIFSFNLHKPNGEWEWEFETITGRWFWSSPTSFFFREYSCERHMHERHVFFCDSSKRQFLAKDSDRWEKRSWGEQSTPS